MVKRKLLLQLSHNDNFHLEVLIEEDKYYFKLYDVAIGLNFVKIDRKNNKEYIRVDLKRINKYFNDAGRFKHKIDDYIDEEDLFYLYDKSRSKVKNYFIDFICNELNINKPVIHVANRFEISFINTLDDYLKNTFKNIKTFKQVCTKNMKYRVDYMILPYNVIIEYDEEHHKYQFKNDLLREKYLNSLGCKIIRVDKGKEGEGIAYISKYIKSIKELNDYNEKLIYESFIIT